MGRLRRHYSLKFLLLVCCRASNADRRPERRNWTEAHCALLCCTPYIETSWLTKDRARNVGKVGACESPLASLMAIRPAVPSPALVTIPSTGARNASRIQRPRRGDVLLRTRRAESLCAAEGQEVIAPQARLLPGLISGAFYSRSSRQGRGAPTTNSRRRTLRMDPGNPRLTAGADMPAADRH